MIKYTANHEITDYYITGTTIINLELSPAGAAISINRASLNVENPIIKWACNTSLGLD